MASDSRQLKMIVGTVLLSGLLVAFLAATGDEGNPLRIPMAGAAACPFIDGGAGDDDASVNGTINITSTKNVAASTTFYDCTATPVVVGATGVIVLGSDLVTGDIAEMNFGTLSVVSGGLIHADAKGCASAGTTDGYAPDSANVCAQDSTGAAGAGQGSNASNQGAGGGGHGAPGGAGSTGHAGGTIYDSATSPFLFGASGGDGASANGGAGGGVVNITVTGTLTLNGTISANGEAGGVVSGGAGGGGAGGSVFVRAAVINGTTGSFQAVGGNGGDATSHDGGGGGGGRIAVIYDTGTFSFDSTDFSVAGGTATGTATAGRKGSAYLADDGGTTLPADDAVTVFHGFTYADAAYVASSWTIDASATEQHCAAAAVRPSVSAATVLVNGTIVCGPEAVSGWNATSLLSFNWSATSSFSIANGASFTVSDDNADVDLNLPNAQTWTNVSLTLPAEGVLTIDDAVALTLSGTTAVNANVSWTNLSSLTVDATASINATAKGCIAASTTDGFAPNGANTCAADSTGAAGGGQGSNASNQGAGGGGHGGTGGNGSSSGLVGGSTYDSAISPVRFGASGGDAATANGGTGGGIVAITASGTVTLNGAVSADGGNGSTDASGASGGGAGGTIVITAPTFNGTII